MALVTNRVVMDSVMRSYNEYLFARAVQYANEKQDAAGEPHIKKRQAIQLREGLSFGPNVTIGSASKKQAPRFLMRLAKPVFSCLLIKRKKTVFIWIR